MGHLTFLATKLALEQCVSVRSEGVLPCTKVRQII